MDVSDIDTVSTGDECWFIICHIVDENSTPDSPSPCHQYIFTVIPVNGAGQGETSQNITAWIHY